MNGNLAILWPMIVQAFLTLAVYGVLAVRRGAARSDEAQMAAWRASGTEPARGAVAARNIANQFELPVLFYAVCLALYVVNGASWLAVLLAWIFAGSRILHAAIHLGPNRVSQRMPVWLVGYAAVAALWLILSVHILGVGGV
ncbi:MULTISPECIES: MAPEG family protein [unclassified Aureimonas]|uniref:MAPEG family protein n=1 Tax=unclassified Aureimonas TaxID=2615206 RepID=UPI0006F5AFE4|nr:MULTISPECIES: MAPEG family protein [unclassified Aureimonas]KQT53807.1 hypothetical protein ASG62_11195 [Aureimonas sp. Leaf427]KQT71752.1 hypothetical protein ASG54_19965 [Aureimonas sp. Leaf460]